MPTWLIILWIAAIASIGMIILNFVYAPSFIFTFLVWGLWIIAGLSYVADK